jgi:hypothetical protein
MANRKVTIRQLVDKETEQQLREIADQFNQNQQKSAQSNQPNQSTSSNQTPQPAQNPEGFPVVVSRAFQIKNEGCSGLRGLTTRVYRVAGNTLEPAELMDKRHALLNVGDVIIEANVVFGQGTGNVRVYQVYFTTDHQAQVKWIATLGPNGQILNHNPTEKNLLDRIYQALFIRARHAVNAAFAAARKASTRHYIPNSRSNQSRRQFPPRNPYMNWR